MTTNKPETIYLIPDFLDGEHGYSWCDDPAPSPDHDPEDAVAYVRADVVDALKAECEKLRKDAERYRWLREQHWSSGEMAVLTRPRESARLGAWLPSRDLLDEAIDTAMAGGEQ